MRKINLQNYSQINLFHRGTISNLGTLFYTNLRLKLLYRIGPWYVYTHYLRLKADSQRLLEPHCWAQRWNGMSCLITNTIYSYNKTWYSSSTLRSVRTRLNDLKIELMPVVQLIWILTIPTIATFNVYSDASTIYLKLLMLICDCKQSMLLL